MSFPLDKVDDAIKGARGTFASRQLVAEQNAQDESTYKRKFLEHMQAGDMKDRTAREMDWKIEQFVDEARRWAFHKQVCDEGYLLSSGEIYGDVLSPLYADLFPLGRVKVMRPIDAHALSATMTVNVPSVQ